MGKFDGYLLLSDFDGTLAHSEKEILPDGTKIYKKNISQENCDAIRYFQSEGGLFTLATGRSIDFLQQWRTHIVPNTYVVCYNGAHVCSPDGTEVLFSRPLEEGFLPLAERVRDACPELEWVYFHSRGEDAKFFKGDPIDPALILPPVYKMVFYAHREQADDYAAKIASLIGDRYNSMRSWVNGIEILMKGATKGSAIPRLKERLGDRARTVVAVGDYENDLDMIRAADIGYAVENAVPSLKEAADRITVSHRESAIAKIIEELERDC